MPEFITVTHPDLPGQTARMVNPRNGWVPITESLADLSVKELRKLAKAKDVDLTGLSKKDDIVAALSASADAEQDSPNAAESTTTPEGA